jgi:hypothetical protein
MKLSWFIHRAQRLYPVLPRPLAARPILARAAPGLFNPAIIPPEDGDAPTAIRVLAREAYYDIDARGLMIGPPLREKTINVLARIDGPTGTSHLTPIAPVRALDGIEDIRFYRLGKRLALSGTRPGLGERKTAVPVIGDCRWNGDELDTSLFDVRNDTAPIEKNWVLFDDAGRLCVERWPGMQQVYEIDLDKQTAVYRPGSEQKLLWSGTKSARLDGGNLFLDHQRAYLFAGGRYLVRFIYRFRYHRDGEAKPRISAKFAPLADSAVMAYISDMTIIGDEVYFGLGLDDKAAQVLAAPTAMVREALGL